MFQATGLLKSDGPPGPPLRLDIGLQWDKIGATPRRIAAKSREMATKAHTVSCNSHRKTLLFIINILTDG